MGISVGVNPPKTPVTEGSNDIAAATLPNVCKMPGPPAPFVPTPLPNIGKSSDKLADCTSTVKIEGKKVAIKGSSYKSTMSPDMASKASGAGLISSTEEGKTEFAAPGSMNVKAEGKNIQLLGDAMTNNGGSPANSGTLPGNVQPSAALVSVLGTADAQAVCEAICANYTPNKLNPNAPPGERGKGAQRDLDSRTPPVGQGEQTQWLPSAAGKAAKGRTTAGTFQSVTTRAGNVARSSTGCGAGTTVRWDRNINGKWIEFKGDYEDYTDNQKKAIKESGGKQPDATVRPSDCGCPEI